MAPAPARQPAAERRRFVRCLGAVLLLAALLRLVLWLPGLRDPEIYQGGDTDEYLALATDLEAAYTAPEGALGDLGLRRTPGYPALLAAARAALPDSLAILALVQIAWGLAVVAATGLTGRRLFGASAALAAALWVAVDPLAAVQSTVLLTETPFVLSLLVAIGATHRVVTGGGAAVGPAVVAGLALAAATFIRPITLYLPLLVVPLLLAGRAGWRRWPAALAFGVAALLPVACWMARNEAVSGVALFSTIEGASLLDYRAAGAIEEEAGIPIADARARARAAAAERVRAGMNAAQVSRVRSRVGAELILEHPVGYARMALRGALMTLFGPGGAELRDRLGGDNAVSRTVVVVAGGAAALLALLACLGGAAAFREGRLAAVLVTCVPLAYLLLVGSGQESYSRFRVPLVPLMALLAGAAWPALRRRLRGARAGGGADPQSL